MAAARTRLAPARRPPRLRRGSTIQIIPNATFDYRFLGWTGDLTGTDTPGYPTLDDHKILSATFASPGTLSSNSIVNAANMLLGAAELALSEVTGGIWDKNNLIKTVFEWLHWRHTGVYWLSPSEVKVNPGYHVQGAQPTCVLGRFQRSSKADNSFLTCASSAVKGM